MDWSAPPPPEPEDRWTHAFQFLTKHRIPYGAPDEPLSYSDPLLLQQRLHPGGPPPRDGHASRGSGPPPSQELWWTLGEALEWDPWDLVLAHGRGSRPVRWSGPPAAKGGGESELFAGYGPRIHHRVPRRFVYDPRPGFVSGMVFFLVLSPPRPRPDVVLRPPEDPAGLRRALVAAHSHLAEPSIIPPSRLRRCEEQLARLPAEQPAGVSVPVRSLGVHHGRQG